MSHFLCGLEITAMDDEDFRLVRCRHTQPLRLGGQECTSIAKGAMRTEILLCKSFFIEDRHVETRHNPGWGYLNMPPVHLPVLIQYMDNSINRVSGDEIEHAIAGPEGAFLEFVLRFALDRKWRSVSPNHSHQARQRSAILQANTVRNS